MPGQVITCGATLLGAIRAHSRIKRCLISVKNPSPILGTCAVPFALKSPFIHAFCCDHTIRNSLKKVVWITTLCHRFVSLYFHSQDLSTILAGIGNFI
jgi:hypothetical protein